MCVVNTIGTALDLRQGTVVLLIDQSAAFGTMDHTVLLNRLQRRYGLVGVVLLWVEPYLSDRRQGVVVGRATSRDTTMHTGAAVGSVLGPLLVSLYVQPIDIIHPSYPRPAGFTT